MEAESRQDRPSAPARMSLRIEEAIGAASMALICIISFANVVVRYATNVSFAFTEEFSVFLLVVMTFVGASLAVATDSHIRIHFFIDRLGPKARAVADAISLLATTAMYAFITYHGALLTLDEWRFGETSPGLGYPNWIYTVWLPVLSVVVLIRVGRPGDRLGQGVVVIEASLLMLLVFIGLLAIGTPIAVALGLSGILGIATGLDSSTVAMVGTVTYASIAKYPLVAIPLFILTGMIFERSGVAGRLVQFASAIVGARRGGLAVVSILVCLIMGGMSGSGARRRRRRGHGHDPQHDPCGLSARLFRQRDRVVGIDGDPDPAINCADPVFDHGAGHRSARAVRSRAGAGLSCRTRHRGADHLD